MHRANCKDKVVSSSGLSFGSHLNKISATVVVAASWQLPGARTWWLRSDGPGGPHLLLQQSNRSCAGATNHKSEVVGCSGLSFGVSLKKNLMKVMVAISRQSPGASTLWFRIARPGGPHLLLQQSNSPCTGPTARTRWLGVLGSPLGSHLKENLTKVVVAISRQLPGASAWWLRNVCPGGPNLLLQQSNRSCAGQTARTRLLGALGSPLWSHLKEISIKVGAAVSQQLQGQGCWVFWALLWGLRRLWSPSPGRCLEQALGG
jgi:hypothetical protein